MTNDEKLVIIQKLIEVVEMNTKQLKIIEQIIAKLASSI